MKTMIKKHLPMLAVALLSVTSFAVAKTSSGRGGNERFLDGVVGYNAGEIFRNSKQSNDVQEKIMQKRRDVDLYLQTQQGRKNAIMQEIQAENDKITARVEEIRNDSSLSDSEREGYMKTAEEEARAKMEPLYSQIGQLDQETRMTHGMRMQQLQNEGQEMHQVIMDRMKEAVETVAKREDALLALDLGLTFYAPGVKDLTSEISKILDEEYAKELEDEKEEGQDEDDTEGDEVEA